MHVKSTVRCATLVVVVGALAGVIGCGEDDCPTGEALIEGECTEPVQEITSDDCADGEVFRFGQCLPPGTPECEAPEVLVDDGDGTFSCQGNGMCLGADPGVCPAATEPGTITVCGSLLDIGTSLPVSESLADPTLSGPCVPGTATASPCNLVIQLQGLTPAGELATLAQAQSYLDRCGRFRFENVEVDTFAHIPIGAITVIDPAITADPPPAGARAPTSTLAPLPAANDVATGSVAFSLSLQTIGFWNSPDNPDVHPTNPLIPLPDNDDIAGALADIVDNGATMLRYVEGGRLPTEYVSVLDYQLPDENAGETLSDELQAATPYDSGTVYYFDDDPTDPDGPGPLCPGEPPPSPDIGCIYPAVNPYPASAPPDGPPNAGPFTGPNGWALIQNHPTDATRPFFGQTVFSTEPFPDGATMDDPDTTFNDLLLNNPCGGLDIMSDPPVLQGIWFPVPFPTPRIPGVIQVIPMPSIDPATEEICGP